MDTGRRFTVTGTDDLGDVHSFATDDAERAEGMRGLMAEDLDNVALTEAEPAPDEIEEAAQARVRELRRQHPNATRAELLAMLFPG